MSCRSNALPDTYSLKSSKIKNPKKILNTKAKVFTGYTEHENISCTESVSSEKAASLTKAYSKKRNNTIFLPKHIDLPNSEVELNTGHKDPNLLGFSHTAEEEIKITSKSMQNTHCENSPIKEEIKLKQRFSNKSKEFTPTYLRNIPAGQPKDPQQLSMNWQQMFGADTNINNMLEMSCFQLLNEKLAAYTSGRFQKHSYNRYYYANDEFSPTPTKSKSMPTNVPMSDGSYMGYQYDNSESSDLDTPDLYLDDSEFYEKFDQQIYEFVTEVDSLLESVSQERDVLVKKVIDQICKEAFHNQAVKLDIFGSLATGLALETSDMDLVVTGLNIEGREDVVDHIQILKEHFANYEYFRNIKAIESASIPVIKLEADLSKIREKFLPNNKNKVDPRMNYLQIDITFDDSKERDKADSFWEGVEWNQSKVHLGLKSIHLVKSYIKEYVHLKEMTLCIKKLLAVNDLNSPYQGGLSSYGVVIMIVAYMNFFSIQNAWVNISQLLMHFLEFYGSKFDENKVGILVNRGGSYYPFNSMSECPIVIKDPLNIENNIGKNTYRINDIKALFESSAQHLDIKKAKFLKVASEYGEKAHHTMDKGKASSEDFLTQLFETSLKNKEATGDHCAS